MRNVYLVTCTRRKLSEKTLAKDLYISPSFIAAREVAEKLGDTWYILSAKHGLVSPETELEPYDQSLLELSENERINWASEITRKLLTSLEASDKITILGDDLYVNYVSAALLKKGIRAYMPLRGRSKSEKMYWLNTYGKGSTHFMHLNRFYEMMSTLKDGLGGMRILNECNGVLDWPKRGVYFLFEDSENRYTFPSTLRVVRVGTHSVTKGSNSTLWQRLRTHRGTVNGDGNHRSSILRLHVGASMIVKSKGELQVPTWGVGQTTNELIKTSERALENEVSLYVGNMKLLWLAIDDDPSPNSDRAYIERNSIALLVGKKGPLDPPSENWLGNYCPNIAVVKSGLWNVNYINNSYDERFLDIFGQYVDITLGKKSAPAESLVPSSWHKSKNFLKYPNQKELL